MSVSCDSSGKIKRSLYGFLSVYLSLRKVLFRETSIGAFRDEILIREPPSGAFLRQNLA